jgi:hypothetical protein
MKMTALRYCKSCGEQIPEGRLKAIPDTETCVNCSTVGKVAGFRVITGKSTYTELQIVNPKKWQELNMKQQRRGTVSSGIMMNERFSKTLRKDKQ